MSTVKKSSILVSEKENKLTEEEIKKLKAVRDKTIKDHKIILK